MISQYLQIHDTEDNSRKSKCKVDFGFFVSNFWNFKLRLMFKLPQINLKKNIPARYILEASTFYWLKLWKNFENRNCTKIDQHKR